MTLFLIPTVSKCFTSCSEPASGQFLEEGLNPYSSKPLNLYVRIGVKGMHFPEVGFSWASSWSQSGSWRLCEAKAVSQDSSQFRIIETKALSCPVLQHGGLYWKLKGGIKETFFFMFPTPLLDFLQTSHRSLIHFRPQCVHHLKEQMSIRPGKQSINSHENKNRVGNTLWIMQNTQGQIFLSDIVLNYWFLPSSSFSASFLS